MNEAKMRYFQRLYEEAPIIECKCGCGTKIKSMDRYGRKKEFVNGHNGRKYADKNQYKREWNHRNREKRYEYKRQYILKRKMDLINMLGWKCENCGMVADEHNLAIFDEFDAIVVPSSPLLFLLTKKIISPTINAITIIDTTEIITTFFLLSIIICSFLI